MKVRQIDRQSPAPPRRRALYGEWLQRAPEVQALVASGWQVSDAVRDVIRRYNLPEPEKAFKGIRAAYYAAQKKEPEA